MKKKLLLSFLSFVSILFVFFPSCKDGKSKQEKTSLTLKIGAMASMDYLPYLVAQEVGIYDSLGLNLEFVKFFSPNDRDAAFRSGQIDGTIIDYSGAMIQQSQGIELSIVTKHNGFFELLSASSILNPSDIKGKTIGISRNSVIEYSCDRILDALNLTENEVRKIEVNKIPVRLEMILSDKLDAGIFPDPFITIGKSKGCNSLFSTKDLGISVTGMMMCKEAIENKSDAIKLLLIGYNEGVKYIQSHPREEWEKVLIETLMLPENLLDKITLPKFTFAELPSDTDCIETKNWLHNKNLIPDTYTAENLVDNRFIP